MKDIFKMKDNVLSMDVLRIKSLAKRNGIKLKSKEVKYQLAVILKLNINELDSFKSSIYFKDKSYMEKADIARRAIDYYLDLGFNINNLLIISNERNRDIKRITKKPFKITKNDYILGYPYLFNSYLIYKTHEIEKINKNGIHLMLERFFYRYKQDIAQEAIENILDVASESYLSLLKQENVPEIKSLLLKLKDSSKYNEEITDTFFYKLLVLSNQYNQKVITLNEAVDEIYYNLK